MSWGCNSYLNSMLIDNENVNILVIGHDKYKNEYSQFTDKEIHSNWFPYDCKNKYFIGNLSTNLNNDNKTKLDEVMNKFLLHK